MFCIKCNCAVFRFLTCWRLLRNWRPEVLASSTGSFLLVSTNNRRAAFDQVDAEGRHVEWRRRPVSTFYCVEVFAPWNLVTCHVEVCCLCGKCTGEQPKWTSVMVNIVNKDNIHVHFKWVYRSYRLSQNYVNRNTISPNAVTCCWDVMYVKLNFWSRNYIFFLILAHPVYKNVNKTGNK